MSVSEGHMEIKITLDGHLTPKFPGFGFTEPDHLVSRTVLCVQNHMPPWSSVLSDELRLPCYWPAGMDRCIGLASFAWVVP